MEISILFGFPIFCFTFSFLYVLTSYTMNFEICTCKRERSVEVWLHTVLVLPLLHWTMMFVISLSISPNYQINIDMIVRIAVSC